MMEPRFVLPGSAQADDAYRILVGAFGERQHVQAITDRTGRNEPDLTVIEAIILALQRRLPIASFRGPLWNAVPGNVGAIPGRVEPDLHDFLYTHPIG